MKWRTNPPTEHRGETRKAKVADGLVEISVIQDFDKSWNVSVRGAASQVFIENCETIEAACEAGRVEALNACLAAIMDLNVKG